MVFATIEDTRGRIELLIFPKILENSEAMWQEDKVIIADGTLSDKDGNFKLLVDSVKEINQQELDHFGRVEATKKKNIVYGKPDANYSVLRDSENFNSQKMIISLPENSTKENFKKLSDIFDQCEHGETKIYLRIGGSKLETPYSIKLTADTLSAVKNIIPEGKIEMY